eukprot:1152034-Pelagomonas_calceolata.AAC.3
MICCMRAGLDSMLRIAGLASTICRRAGFVLIMDSMNPGCCITVDIISRTAGFWSICEAKSKAHRRRSCVRDQQLRRQTSMWPAVSNNKHAEHQSICKGAKGKRDVSLLMLQFRSEYGLSQ